MKAEIELPKFTPQQIAQMFWDLDDSGQAEFFGSLGAMTLATPEGYCKLDLQMCYASESPMLTPNGARVMELIGGWANGKRLQPLA